MFDIGWTELLVIAVVAIVVIGPKDLPRALRTLGQWTTKVKRMASDFQGQFTEAIREAELDSVQRDLESITRLDPLGEVRAAAAKTGEDIRRDLEKSAPAQAYPWESTEAPSWATKAEPPGSSAPPAAPAASAAAPAAPASPAAPEPPPAPVETRP